MINLENKTIVITGGASSIGYDIAKKLVAIGAQVLIGDINKEKGDEVAQNLGKNAVFLYTDVTKDKECFALIEKALHLFGKIDVLINCAVSYGDDGAKTSRETWISTLNTNVVSPAILGEIARPHLKETKGSIINIGSISGVFPHIERWTYPVSKASLRHLTKTQALEYAKDGIRVNMLRLGHVWSDPFRTLTKNNRQHADKITSSFNLMGRVANGEEVANAVAFLASDLASYITGSETLVDGGYSAMGPEQHVPLMPLLTL